MLEGMRFLSLDDNEPGIIAVGAAPIGILAIGGTPVGVIAVGFGAVGGVAVSCGGSAGIVAVSCGAALGGFATGVGLTLGVKSSCVGVALSVLPGDEDAPYPSSTPRVPTEFETKGLIAADVDATGARVMSGWAFITPARDADGKWSLHVRGELVVLDREARATLERWDGRDAPILAHLAAERVAGDAESAGYREASAPRVALRCDRILLPETAPRAPEDAGLFGRRLWWIAKTLTKLGLLLFGLLVAGWTVKERFADLRMTRVVETSWRGTIKRAEGMAFPGDTECSIKATFRGDGASRFRAYVQVDCGTLAIYPRDAPRCEVTEIPRPGTPGSFGYKLSCTDKGSAPSDDSKGRPSLDLDTEKRSAVIAQPLPSPFHVQLDVAPESTLHRGEPLFDANR
jgi:hypothetical protein